MLQTQPGAAQPDVIGQPDIQLELMRGFALHHNGRFISVTPGIQRLIALVALQDRPVQRGYVASALWSDSSEERAGANLRSRLSRLRSTGCALIEGPDARLRLAPGVRVDLHQLTERARRVMDLSVDCPSEDLDERWYAGDLLPDWYDKWVLIDRERFRQLRLHALEAVATRLVASGRHGQAVQVALLAVRDEPLRESAQRALVTAYLAEGNRREALVQYTRYRDSLRRELGVEPSATFTDLIKEFRGGVIRRSAGR